MRECVLPREGPGRQAQWFVVAGGSCVRGIVLPGAVHAFVRVRTCGSVACMPVGDMGEEWIVDAFGCEPDTLRDLAALRSLTDRILGDVGLHALSDGFWHTFPGEGGVTGLVPLRESHLALHTYPEHGVAAFNLYCCRSGCHWTWKQRLREALGATDVTVRRVERGRSMTVQSSKPSHAAGEVAREE